MKLLLTTILIVMSLVVCVRGIVQQTNSTNEYQRTLSSEVHSTNQCTCHDCNCTPLSTCLLTNMWKSLVRIECDQFTFPHLSKINIVVDELHVEDLGETFSYHLVDEKNLRLASSGKPFTSFRNASDKTCINDERDFRSPLSGTLILIAKSSDSITFIKHNIEIHCTIPPSNTYTFELSSGDSKYYYKTIARLSITFVNDLYGDVIVDTWKQGKMFIRHTDQFFTVVKGVVFTEFVIGESPGTVYFDYYPDSSLPSESTIFNISYTYTVPVVKRASTGVLVLDSEQYVVGYEIKLNYELYDSDKMATLSIDTNLLDFYFEGFDIFCKKPSFIDGSGSVICISTQSGDFTIDLKYDGKKLDQVKISVLEHPMTQLSSVLVFVIILLLFIFIILFSVVFMVLFCIYRELKKQRLTNFPRKLLGEEDAEELNDV